jgi:hypothetical protein
MDLSHNREQDHTHQSGSLAALKRVRQAQEWEPSGNSGEVLGVSHSIDRKGIGLVNNSTHAVSVKHPPKSLLDYLAPKPKAPLTFAVPKQAPQFAKPPSPSLLGSHPPCLLSGGNLPPC